MPTAASKHLSTVLLAVVAVTFPTGCVGPFVPPPRPSESSSVAPPTSSAPACVAPAGDSAAAPIVGEWVCTGSTTEMRFRFSADGKYKSREALEYEASGGRFVFHRDQDGTYVTAGDQLELNPARSTRTRKAPDDPAGDYTDQPEALKRRVFTFRAGRDALHLHESGGYALVLLRDS